MSLPFTIPEVHWGMSSVRGTLRLTNEYLIFSVSLTVVGLLKRPPVTIKVAPEALHTVRYKRGLFHDSLIIRPHGQDLLRSMPGNHEDVLKLRIKKEYRREAEHLVEKIRDWALLHLYE